MRVRGAVMAGLAKQLGQAARRYRHDIATGRLALHPGSMTQLPFGDGTLNGALTVNTIYFVAKLERAFTELARVIGSSGRIVIGLADPDARAKKPFTGHGFHLRPVPDVIDTLRSTGLIVTHRRVSEADNAPHLLIATAARETSSGDEPTPGNGSQSATQRA